MDAPPTLMSYCDRDSRYVLVNKTFEQWLGRPAAELTGPTVEDVLGAETFQTISLYMREALPVRRRMV